MAVQQNPYSVTDRFGRMVAQNIPFGTSGNQQALTAFIQDLVSKGYDLSGGSLTGGPSAGGIGGLLSNMHYLDSIIGQSTAPSLNPATGQPTGPDVVSPLGGQGGGGSLPQPPQSIDPNQPLSTPETPVNQSTAPSDISQFIPGASTQQQNIINQAIQQSQNVAGQNVQSLQDVLNPYVTAQMKNWTDPNSPDYQATMGQLNNVGRADQNTFGQSLSSRLAPLLAENQMKLGTGALLPSFLNQQGLVSSGAGIQSTLGLEPLNRFVEMQNWNMQKDLANQLAKQGASASFGSGIGGLLGGGLGAAAGSSFGPAGMMVGSMLGSQGGSAAGGGAGGLSWICTHLKKLKLATEEEVENVHKRLRSTIFTHPLEWLHYIYCAPRLIDAADRQKVSWEEVKPRLIDAVLAEPNSERAWQLYRAECQRLTLAYAPELWTLEVIPC